VWFQQNVQLAEVEWFGFRMMVVEVEEEAIVKV
jgi:hypothetical protein